MTGSRMTPADDPRATPEIDEDAIRAWTSANRRARIAYHLRELELANRCSSCNDRPRDGRHSQCWTCRHADQTKRKNR